jgi:hypothetical protein
MLTMGCSIGTFGHVPEGTANGGRGVGTIRNIGLPQLWVFTILYIRTME